LTPTREIHCADALPWLAGQPPLSGCSFITSLPDASELPSLSRAQWRDWFVSAAHLVLSKTPDDGAAVFYQTDVKVLGEWVDKGHLVSLAADRAGARMLFHKIVLRRAPGHVAHGRAGYSHLLAFSRGVKLDLSRATTDVLPTAGESSWTRGMGDEACAFACRFVLSHTKTRTIVDPFCGRGSVLAVANALGLDAVGVEISNKRCRHAKVATLRAASSAR
jgi:hypothetical protein